MQKITSNPYAMLKVECLIKKNISKELVIFYALLYSKNQQCCEKDCRDFIQTLLLSSINRKILSECEKPITDNESQKAILQLTNNKSAGLDGSSIEF